MENESKYQEGQGLARRMETNPAKNALEQEVRQFDPMELLVLANGDLAKLSNEARLQYFLWRCKRIHVDPMTGPLFFAVMDGKLTLGAKRQAAEQVRSYFGITITELDASMDSLMNYTVKVKGMFPNGREDQDIGVVNCVGKTGKDLQNAMLTAVTKAKNRLTWSMTGDGFLDKSEVESVPGAQYIPYTKALPLMPDEMRDKLTEIERKAVDE